MKRETAVAVALLALLVVLPSVPRVEAQSQYKINDLGVFVTPLDDRSARVVMDYNFTWLQGGTVARTWNFAIDSGDAHGIRVESGGVPMAFTVSSEGDISILQIELGRDVAAGQSLAMRVEYVTSSNLDLIGPERKLSMSIWEDAPKDRMNLTVIIPEGFRLVSHEPPFLEQPEWGGGRVLTGVELNVPSGTNPRLVVGYSSMEAEYNLTYVYTFTNDGIATEYGAEVEVPVFAEAPRQTVTQLRVSPTPTSAWYDDSANSRARFRFDAIPAGGTVDITITYTLRVTLGDAPDFSNGEGSGTIPPSYLVYTQGDKYWEVENSTIASLASNLTVGLMGVLEKAEAIYNFVSQNISYDYDKYNAVMSGIRVERYGALKTLELGRGVCEDITDLYVTLCRASGIPAVETTGYIYTGDGEITQANRHAWAEVYIPSFGWMDVDPTWKLLGLLEGRHVGDRLFMNSSEPDYLVWSSRQHFTYGVETSIAVRPEDAFYLPELFMGADYAEEAVTGIPYPVHLALSNVGNGTAFSTKVNVTGSENVDLLNGNFYFERIWGYDYLNFEVIVNPTEPGNSTLLVHLEYTGEDGGHVAKDYSYSFPVVKKPAYSIEGLAAAMGPTLWVALGAGLGIALLACLLVWGSRRAGTH